MMGDPVIKANWASPYPGLRPFRTDESELFFGRRQQYVRMINILKRHNFLAVVGSSGCGKSSLVKAGLLPQLSNPKFSIGDAGCEWVYVVARPGGGPYRNLAVELAMQCPDRNAKVDTVQVERRLRAGTDGLMDAIYSVPELATRNVFVLIDQFEEIFRFGDTSKRRISELERTKLHDDSLAFVDTLLSTAEARNPQVYVAITMRSDSMGRCDLFQRLPEAVTRSQFLPPRMTKEQLLDAIRCPLEHFNGSIDDAVVSDLLEAMGDRHDQLPVVQHALAQIWKFASERTSQGESCCITTEDADRCRQQTSASIASTIPARLAWVTEAISTHADVVFESLGSPQRQRIARAMFCALCQIDNNEEPERRLTSVREVAEIVYGDNITEADVQETELVADAFAAEGHNFVVRSTTADGKEALDVSHESLLRQWSRLNEWIDNESDSALSYRRLIDEVESGETCLTETHLEQAQFWLKESQPNAHWAMRYDGAENPESSALKRVVDLIEKSCATKTARLDKEKQVAEREQELLRAKAELESRRASEAVDAARKAVRMTWNVAAACGLAVLFLISALYNLNQATRAAADAEQNEREAKASELKAEESREAAEHLQADANRQNADHYWRFATIARDAEDSKPIKAAHLFLQGAASLDLVVPKLKSPVDVRGISTNALAASIVDENLIQSWVHDGGVTGAQISGDATRVLTWRSFDGTVLWDVTKPEPIRTFESDGVLSGAQLSGDATRVLTWDFDGKVRLWDVTKAEPIQTFSSDGKMSGAQLSGDHTRVLTFSADDGTARLWDVTKPKSIQTFKHGGESYDVYGAQLSGDATRVLTFGHEEGTARLWDVTKPEPIQTFEHDGGLFNAQLSGDATRVLTHGKDGSLRLWDVTKPEPINTFKPDEWVSGAQLSGDALVLTHGKDGTIRMWDVTKPEPIQTFKSDDDVSGAHLSGDHTRVLTWDQFGTVRMWDVTKPAPINTFKPDDWISGAQLSGDHTRILTFNDEDGTIRIWDATEPDPIKTFKPHVRVSGSQLSCDYTRVLNFSDEGGSAQLWNLTKSELIRTFERDGGVCGAKLSGDATRVLTHSKDGTICLWDVTKPEPIQTFKHDDAVWDVQLNGDATRVLTLGNDGTMRLWDVTKPEPIQTFRPVVGVYGALLGPDATRALIFREDAAVLWDVTIPEPIQTFKHDSVDGAQFSVDATRVLTWGRDGKLRLWDLNKPEPIQTFKADGPVRNSQVSGDVTRVVSWGYNFETAVLWDVTKPEPIYVFRPKGGVDGARVSGDAARVLTWSNKDRTVQLWDVTDPLANLSPAERVLELEVRSAATLDANLELRTLKFDEWQGKVKSPEYQAILKKLPARNAGIAKPQK